MTGILIVPKPKARGKKAARKRACTDPHEALERFEQPEVQRRFRKAMAKWEKLLDEETRALREAQRITAADLNVTINVRAGDP
jgi:hypothetical protein